MSNKYRFRISEEERKALGLPKKKENRFYLNEARRAQLREMRGETFGCDSPKEAIEKHMHDEISKAGLDRYMKYEGTQSLQSEEEAIEYFNVDTDKWEVDKFVVNSWDVNMKGGRKTNYQVKLWLKRIEKVKVSKPKEINIKVDAPKRAEMWVVLGCVHRPFHNKKLWKSFLKFLKYYQSDINGIIINGDFLDLRSLSSHDDYIPDGIDLSVEYSDGLQGISEIQSAIGDGCRKIFQYGNHEERFDRDRANIRKYGSALPTPAEALRLEEDDWEIQYDWKNGFITLGKDLDVFHGSKHGINAAKAELDLLPHRSGIFNHTHRFQSFSNNNKVVYNVGWFGDADSDAFKYFDRGQRFRWANGFAVAYIDDEGNHHVHPVKCSKNRIFFHGKIFK